MPRLASGGIDIRLSTRELSRQLGQFRRLSSEAALHAAEVVAQELLRDSQLYVPVLTGALRDSGHTQTMPSISDARQVVRVVYPLDYAWRQHEVPYWHPSLGFYGAAKFLEEPLDRFGDFYLELFQAEYQAALRRGL